jgi:hypothetical protein
MYLQFKRSECMTRSSAKEIRNGATLSTPFYRFHLMDAAKSDQHRLLLQLFELYYLTDPLHGPKSEEDKLENARTAIELWWYVYAELMLWAQSHLAGYELARSDANLMAHFEKILGEGSTVDSHLLEYLGLEYSFNRVNDDDEFGNFVGSELLKKKVGLDKPALRYLIRELLVSRSANSSFWRFELQSALFELNVGHVEELLKPEPIRRQGNPIRLLNWKVKALQHVYFLVGKGHKKYRALHSVAEAIGQSIETLRDWEKSIINDDDYRMSLVAARLAGEHEEELDKKSPLELRATLASEYHRNMSDIERAHYTLREIRTSSLSAISKGIRLERTPKKGAGKRVSDTSK